MKQKDIVTLVFVGVVAGIASLIISSKVFSTDQKSVQVPVVEVISSEFPDLKNDPTYSAVFNKNALDPTQLIQIGNTQNSAPFNGQ